MGKLRPADLEKIAEKMRRTTALRDGAARARITVHMGTCGISAGARPIMTALMADIDKQEPVATAEPADESEPADTEEEEEDDFEETS